MKTFCVLISMLFLSIVSFGQASYLERIKPCPTVPSKEAVDAFHSSLDSLLEEITPIDEKFKADNEAAAKNIDQAKMAQMYQNYGQNTTVDNVKEMQKVQQAVLDDNKKLTALSAQFRAKKDSIDALYKIDKDVFSKEYLNYINKCMGEVDNPSTCNALLSKLNESRTKILDKYFFGGSALYVKYLTEYRASIVPVSAKAGLDAITLSELSLLGTVVFPHKEDMVYIEIAKDIIGEISSVFVIDYTLWPAK